MKRTAWIAKEKEAKRFDIYPISLLIFGFLLLAFGGVSGHCE